MIKELLVVSTGGLGLVMGAVLTLKALETTWVDRHGEFAAALSERFQAAGAPSKEVADKAANCVADVLTTQAHKVACSVEGEDVLQSMGRCIDSNRDMQQVYTVAFSVCIQDATR